ncbi:MAG: FAD-binding protein [Spirochaetaceae bacterium]|nr:MAG: FAD-binding protein [Spirochaetaceae bacterium]
MQSRIVGTKPDVLVAGGGIAGCAAAVAAARRGHRKASRAPSPSRSRTDPKRGGSFG